MRTDKELLELLLKELPKLKEPGLCGSITQIMIMGKITPVEELALSSIIRKNPTERGKKRLYYFPPYELAPRIEYLKQLIEKYENS